MPDDNDVFKQLAKAEAEVAQYEDSIAKETKPALKVNREERDLMTVLETPSGRRFIYSILDAAGTYGPTFAETDRQTAFNEGMRYIGLLILRRIEVVNLPAYFQMLNEHKSDIIAEKERKKREENANG